MPTRHLDTAPRPVSAGRGLWWSVSRTLVACLALAVVGIRVVPTSGQDGDDAESVDEHGESGVYLPTDRNQERLLDRAIRTIAAGQWSDAAALLDEILGAERDSFFRPRAADAGGGTWSSVKAEAARRIGGLPQAGREAYELQFRARAERALAEAIAANDRPGILAVARRWFATPAGRRAAVLAAVDALESNQPLSAAAWLERLGDADDGLGPTLAVMLALARDRAGDQAAAAAVLERARAASRGTARIAGRDVTISFPQDRGVEWLRELAGSGGSAAATADWLQPRGDASRNAVVRASRPLLVPRYRVPLAAHPEESRRLESLRRERADAGSAAFAAGTPLAVDGTILARAPLGLLAVDFATGKRLWLQPGVRSAAAEGREALARTFDDFTSGGISSDGRLAFVVDSHPEAMAAMIAGAGLAFGGPQRRPAWQGGNTLSAYDIAAAGRLVWRLPAKPEAGADREGEPAVGTLASTAWYAGAPLAVGDRLYVLVEEKAELRLDVLAAADGRTVWSQPLAELDEVHAIVGRDGAARRLTGATPTLGDGVLVCPVGAGSVIAVDLANRALLWAYQYARDERGRAEAVLFNGRLRGFPGGIQGVELGDGTARPRAGWCAEGPVVAGGRVLLTPPDSDELHCLELRDGAVRWKVVREGRLLVAGAVDGRVIVVGRDAVEALALDTGRPLWRRPLEAGVSPSGRGILTADRLFLPVDAPEVIEIALADGAVAGRSPARGGAVPGNLVAYRGEVISLGVDAIDVFHQAAVLEERVETASREQPVPAWAAVWAAQLALDRGAVRDGLTRLQEAMRADPGRQPPDMLAAALAYALRRDFAAAVPSWKACLPATGLPPPARAAVRAVVDGCLAAGGDPREAWAAWRELEARGRDGEAAAVAHASDPSCAVADRPWLRGRLQTLWQRADEPLRAEIDAALTDDLAAAARLADAAARTRRLAWLAGVAGDAAAGMAARERLVAELSAAITGAGVDDAADRAAGVRRDFLLLDLARFGNATQQAAARAAIADIRRGLAAGDSAAEEEAAAAWPLGRVEVRRSLADRDAAADETRSRLVPVRFDQAAESFLPGLSAACDAQQSRLLFVDRFGRRVGDGVPVNDEGRGIPLFDQSTLGVSSLGRVVFVRSGAAVSAVELGARENGKLWSTADAGQTVAQVAGRLRGPMSAIPRHGAVPLGMRILEAGAAAEESTVWGRPETVGVPLFSGRTLTVHDPVDGSVLWERHRLPAATDLFNDDRLLCLGTADGRRSLVLSMADGRVLHEIDLPDRRCRLLSRGSRILAIGGLDGPAEGGVAATVRLEVIDLQDRSTTSLGEFPGGARACPFAADMLAVVEPGGGLAVIDVAARRVALRTRLPAMPAAIDHVEVVPWERSLLVCVGSRVPAGEDDDLARFTIAPLQQMLVAGTAVQPLDFSVWAVDRETGDPLWNAPATVTSHCLLAGQPVGLPVLVFARQIQRNNDRASTYLGVLCLDKRTGHAVLDDDRIPAQPHLLFGCDVVGDPLRHTITVREHGGDPQRVAVAFTGGPTPPRPPHQAGRSPRADDVLGGLGRWLERALVPDRGR